MEAYSSGRLEFLLLWRDGRVTPGWAICLVHLLSGVLGGPLTRWMPLPAATTRSRDLQVYERRSRGLTTLTELLGKGFGLWRKALGVGRWVRGRVTPGALGVQILGVGCSRATTTRSPDGILCEASIYVVLKHP